MTAFIPYPAVEAHGVIGDRRTAALVASDGTIDWLCLPDYDGRVVFGALLDANRGGFWRVGPAMLRQGAQHYLGRTPILSTCWSATEYDVELVDAMLFPHDRDASTSGARIVLRRLHCRRGSVDCVSAFSPASHGRDKFWCSDPAMRGVAGARRLRRGETVWFVFGVGASKRWTAAAAERALHDVERFWTDELRTFHRLDPRLVRSAVTIRLLEYAPAGSIVAAPTTSVPERIGGSWNADYRLTWVRDASLSIGTLARLGDLASATRYFDWIVARDSVTRAPLQVAYEVRGGRRPDERSRRDLDGYRGSKPVRFGNHAYRQQQHDEFGYLADCALTYLEHGGEWDPRLWGLLARCADYVAGHWRQKGNGIWELTPRQRHVSGRVMAWVTLDRVLRIAARLRLTPPQLVRWRRVKQAIHDDVMTNGWSESLRAFKQSIETDALDASALLIPMFGFLPVSDPRVVSTVTRIAERLTIDGCVYRFDPHAVPNVGPSPMGEFEAAFLPCTFWLATAFAMLGRRRDAEDILRAAEAAAGPLGLFAEAIDPRDRAFRGNTPLLFSHVEYVRAVQALNDLR